MATWSKGTLVGETRRADVVLPVPVVHEESKVVGAHWQVVQWSPVAARWTATAALLFAACPGLRTAPPAGAAPRVLAAVAVTILAGGAGVSRAQRERAGFGITHGGGATGMLAVWAAASHAWPAQAVGWDRSGRRAVHVPASLPLGRDGLIGGGTMAAPGAAAAVWDVFGLDAP
ncbi:hypothetical protein F8568_045970 [Actinomadura sp. LD22]|uniref:Uncharacterized protein n=1 Tax=Actinomadura physcomitrii TaxID=2650748 RepID=A0A6I4MRE3_9ACTN|nr:hypothetical protein [Actinomadura physcomitrii]MWA07550.1 hypothetical protein [Actinomadura physcomitrii]